MLFELAHEICYDWIIGGSRNNIFLKRSKSSVETMYFVVIQSHSNQKEKNSDFES